jgi:hypothetical protein
MVRDVLLFSANMIHRGLHRNNRLALDTLYCEHVPQLTTELIQLKHQPSAQMLPDFDKAYFNVIKLSCLYHITVIVLSYAACNQNSI